jgi:hypothetical protein
MLKEVVMAQLEVLLWYSHEGTEENREQPHPEQLDHEPEYELRISGI